MQNNTYVAVPKLNARMRQNVSCDNEMKSALEMEESGLAQTARKSIAIRTHVHKSPRGQLNIGMSQAVYYGRGGKRRSHIKGQRALCSRRVAKLGMRLQHVYTHKTRNKTRRSSAWLHRRWQRNLTSVSEGTLASLLHVDLGRSCCFKLR